MARQALFDGLVFDEDEQQVASKLVGDESFYVIDDDGFMRHVESEQVDRQVLQLFLDQLSENKDMAVSEAMRLMGKDDIFTKAALDAQMRNVNAQQIIEQGIPEQARNMLGMLGFRIVINVHGEVVRLDQPTVPDDQM
ncbi:MAG: hypothetical protein ACOCXI_07050 [Chloroflexota bacterium]